MSDDELQEVINSVGTIAEMLALLRNALIRNDFEPDEVMYLCGVYMECLIKK